MARLDGSCRKKLISGLTEPRALALFPAKGQVLTLKIKLVGRCRNRFGRVSFVFLILAICTGAIGAKIPA